MNALLLSTFLLAQAPTAPPSPEPAPPAPTSLPDGASPGPSAAPSSPPPAGAPATPGATPTGPTGPASSVPAGSVSTTPGLPTPPSAPTTPPSDPNTAPDAAASPSLPAPAEGQPPAATEELPATPGAPPVGTPETGNSPGGTPSFSPPEPSRAPPDPSPILGESPTDTDAPTLNLEDLGRLARLLRGDGASTEPIWEGIPFLNERGLGIAFRRTLWASLAILLVTRVLRNRPTRWPALTLWVGLILRIIAGVAGLGALLALLPPTWAPLAALLLAGLSLAGGLAAWPIFVDVVSGLALLSEPEPILGRWVEGEGFRGKVLGVGLRSTWVEEPGGVRLRVPHRKLLGLLRHIPQVLPRAEVSLRLPPDLPAPQVRRALAEAARLCPWTRLDGEVSIAEDPLDPGRWTVAIPLVDLRFESALRGTFGGHARASLSALLATAHPALASLPAHPSETQQHRGTSERPGNVTPPADRST